MCELILSINRAASEEQIEQHTADNAAGATAIPTPRKDLNAYKMVSGDCFGPVSDESESESDTEVSNAHLTQTPSQHKKGEETGVSCGIGHRQ